MDEIKEIEIRKKNVMIFGLNEDEDKNFGERKEHDEGVSRGIFGKLGSQDAEIRHTQRVGEMTAIRRLPLKVALRRSTDKRDILRNANKLRKTQCANVYINDDLTPLQQMRAKQKIRHELKERRQRGIWMW